MIFKILSPEEAAKRSRAKRGAWEKRQEIEEKKARLEAQRGKARSKTIKTKPGIPLTEPITRDWPKLDLNQVETMITRANGVPAWEAIERADKEGKIIIPNCVHDRMLVETKHWKKPEINAGYWAWTGTGVIYEAPNKPFGEAVVFIWQNQKIDYSVSFTVPKQFQGMENCVLVVEHPDFGFTLVGKNKYELKIKDENLIHLLENFPKEDGWHHYDERLRIPVGEKLDDQQADDSMRYLWRIDNHSYVGLLARLGNIGGSSWRQNVGASRWLSDGLGVHSVALPVSGFEFPVKK